MKPYRNEYQAMTPEGGEMNIEFEKLFKTFHSKWRDTFTRDEILSCVVSSAGLVIAEDTLIRALAKRKEEKS